MHAQSRKSQIANRKSGVALVITLILLSVTLVMAVAFLAISRRGRANITTTQDATTAKFAADSGLQRAEARIVSQIEMTTNPYIFSLIVSTNYINRLGFTDPGGNPSVSLTNVNYDYEAQPPNGNGGGPISGADFLQNIANLYYNPRPPVFYSNDFRFYLDLNRNGRYDTNGVVQLMDDNGKPILTRTNTPIYNLEVGDPEWIGILAHPDQPHSANNPFIARYCFIAVPANSADLNYIHNQALDAGEGAVNAPQAGIDGYWRDQDVGTWELNLAAFLTDLNTNRWDPFSPGASYSYPEGTVNGTGFGASIAFDDARALVSWRYDNYTIPFLASADNLFGGAAGLGDFAFRNAGIDYYDQAQQYTFDTNYYNVAGFYGNPSGTPWLGAPQTNNFFSSPSDLFNVGRSDLDFVNNLYSAGTNQSTYDRYTFYRMLGELGSDTQPASGKINLNYQNAIVGYDSNRLDVARYGFAINYVSTNITIVANMETNFVSWKPQDFFTAAVDRMLRSYTAEWYEASPSNYMQTYYGYYGNVIGAPVSGYYSFTNLDGMNITNIQYYGQTNQIPSFGITNIPVVMNGSFVYSPAVNRILQLAANIYDASTNTTIPMVDSNYPSVFRPVFYKAVERNYFLNRIFTNIYIKGFQYVQEVPGTVPTPNNNDLADPAAYDARTMFATPVELTDLPFGYSTTNVWGIPWIVGAKKGLPNFNGFELDNTIFVERELQVNRNNATPQPPLTPFPYGRIYTTNQMYLIGISNSFAMDDWNSYGNSYNNKLFIFAQNMLSVAVTNSDNLNVVNPFATNVASEALYWPGQQFATPFGSNITVIQNLAFPPSPASANGMYVYYYTPRQVPLGNPTYTYQGPCFIPASLDPSNYLDQGTPPLPQFGLMATNHLQAFILDTDSSGNTHILDYVQLGNMNSTLNVNAAIADPDSGTYTGDNAGLWSTNFYADSDTPYGVVEQMMVSSGSPFPSEDSDQGSANPQGWTTAPVPGLGSDYRPAAQQAFFSAFFSAQDEAPYLGVEVTNIELSMQAPFTPMRCILQRFVFQANDPLVHYMSSDLNDFADDASNKVNLTTIQTTNSIKTIGTLSDRYLPWGSYNPGFAAGGEPPPAPVNQLRPPIGSTVTPDENQFNFAYKDPLVWSADNWDFPTNKYPSVGWLGRVHRGTPWQTVYLKSTNIWNFYTPSTGGPLPTGAYTWQVWTGNPIADDAWNEIPAQDRLLFDIFTAAPDDDAMRGQVSVNIGADDATNMLAGLASWSALLSGTTVFATNNTTPDFQIQFDPGYQQPAAALREGQQPYYNLMTNQPLGDVYPNGNIVNSPLWQIVQGINSTRTNFVTIDGLHGTFEHVGDILATPELSDGSPYLADPGQMQYGMSDEMFEWLPQQMMGLMTVSGTPQNPPRYVVYCYGQTLKPAPNGLVSTSGQYFGMCTNYQVTAESAARVVIEVQNTPTPANPTATPHVVVEQYNPLPPD